MTYIMVDIESDGPIPGDYSMIEIGAIVVEKDLNRTFFGQIRPISDKWIEAALEVSGNTREATLSFAEPVAVMTDFKNWIRQVNRPMFVSDNNGFDWQFVNYYFHHFLGENPFGFSSTNLGSLYKGMQKNVFENFKHLRRTKHTHNPLDDARGNAEAMLAMREMGLKF
jgi:DNA polymerase III alpha subunit (gram-positive type)